MDFKKLPPGVKRNVLLKNYTTFKIGGKAKYFFVAKTKKEIISAVSAAKKYNLPFFILGEGSNILVSDEGYKGLVIKIKNQKSKIENQRIYTEAGALLGQLVNFAFKNNLAGLEWAIGIPGTVGGAISGNCGAFGRSMADIVKEVEVFDVAESRIKNYELKDCKFSYRDSVFKKKKNLIILSAELQLKKGDKEKIKNRVKEFLEYRKETQPLNFSSVGSIFKNTKKFFAAELIEKCGLKGKAIGNIKISDRHANFIVNSGNGKAKDVIKLIKLIKQKVKNKFGIKLEEEIQYLK
ncbi:UDP-N-acetylmuramate dehydrogenase [Patescibacteria group bacterium]|nr:UDP-N-acetylmuramate dehydrogenase [Patescibacteria group bacterium]